MGIMLGNLSVPQLEKRLGIKLTDEEREFLENTRQQKAEDIEKNKWHCFDIPFTIVCGSEKFAQKLVEILTPYSDKMAEPLRIAYN